MWRWCRWLLVKKRPVWIHKLQQPFLRLIGWKAKWDPVPHTNSHSEPRTVFVGSHIELGIRASVDAFAYQV